MNFFEDPSKIVIEKKKVVGYLLNVSHPDGGGKAKLLIQHGFDSDNIDVFINSVITHAQKAETISELETPFGTKIILEGILDTPSGKPLLIKSVWILSSKTPILVTLYPVKK